MQDRPAQDVSSPESRSLRIAADPLDAAPGSANASTLTRSSRTGARRRRRDRHGRAHRTETLPLYAPGRLSREEIFNDYVLDSADRLSDLHGPAVEKLTWAVRPVPDNLEKLTRLRTDAMLANGGIPLGQLIEQDGQTVVVIYRRVVEQLARNDVPLADAVHDAVVEVVATYLHLDPESVDPQWGRYH